MARESPDPSQHERIWQTVFAQSPLSGHRRLAYMQEVLLRHYFDDRRLADHDAPFLSGWILAPGTIRPDAGATSHLGPDAGHHAAEHLKDRQSGPRCA